jgi:hypothetical protein
MRWIAILGLVLATSSATARAKIVIMDPPLVRACPRAATWEAVDKCLHKQGKPTILRSLPTARLVQLQQHQDTTDYDAGVFLYMQRGNEWRLAGLYEARGGDYEVLAMDSLKVGNHVGFRIDIGQLYRTAVSPDGVTSVPALVATRQSMFCGGDTWRCTEVTTACDIYVRGGSMASFRGTAHVADNNIRVDGDRKYMGQFCSIPDQEFLGWSQTPQ